jgi:hypothetical protein
MAYWDDLKLPDPYYGYRPKEPPLFSVYGVVVLDHVRRPRFSIDSLFHHYPYLYDQRLFFRIRIYGKYFGRPLKHRVYRWFPYFTSDGEDVCSWLLF